MLFAALLAVTFNLLLPLVHAALLGNGGPDALTAWCKASAADPERSTPRDHGPPGAPSAAGPHDCCLGLAHAASLVVPSGSYIVPPPEALAPVLWPAAQRPRIAIRDGPPRPRGPPASLKS